MADATPARRVLPARNRRESTVKQQASSPLKPASPVIVTPRTAGGTDTKSKRRPEKRAKVVHVSTPTRSASTPTSTTDEILPTRLIATRPLPTSSEKQADDLPSKQYQSLADSAILAASLHRSRVQWLCDGVFKKYWTKPVRRKKAPPEEPLNNPDIKSMQKLGSATITIEPHTFDATFYVVRDASVLVPPSYKPPVQTPLKQPTPAPPASSSKPAVHAPVISNVPNAAAAVPKTPAPTGTTPTPTPAPLPAPPPPSARPPTPPGGAKTTDPVIQMLASRAATDNHLKELMKVVATSRASPEQLREFQAHIDEFNTIVKRQKAEEEAKKLAASTSTPPPPATTHATPYRNSPLNPGPGPGPSPHYTPYATQPRPEPMIKHVVIELTSQAATGQPANPDRWLFPEYSVLDTQYGGTEMTCSFFVERRGSDILPNMKDLSSEEMHLMSARWKADKDYYQPVTMVVNAASSRIIATIAGSAKSLPDVQKHMQEVMENKSRAPQEYLVYLLPKEKPDTTADFVDSAVELEDDELRDSYPL